MITPWYVGQLSPIWTIQLIPDSGYVNVTGLVVGNFSLRILNTATGVETTGQGTFSNITAAVTTQSGGQTIVVTPASVQYQPVAADVVAGIYTLWCDVTFANGKEPFLIGTWQVLTE